MTEKEFKAEYEKLESAFQDFNNPHRKAAIASGIKDLSPIWWAYIVKRMLISGNSKFNIEDAAMKERERLWQIQKQKEIAVELDPREGSTENYQKIKALIGGKGLESALGKMIDEEEQPEKYFQK